MSTRFTDEADPDEIGPDPETAAAAELDDVDAEVPVADALDQHRPMDEERFAGAPTTIPADVPEADALDQSRPATVDDDGWDEERA